MKSTSTTVRTFVAAAGLVAVTALANSSKAELRANPVVNAPTSASLTQSSPVWYHTGVANPDNKVAVTTWTQNFAGPGLDQLYVIYAPGLAVNRPYVCRGLLFGSASTPVVSTGFALLPGSTVFSTNVTDIAKGSYPHIAASRLGTDCQ